MEAVLGRDGVGLADCAIAESKFEKGEDIAPRMLTLLPRMSEIRRTGTPDIEFAATGLLARSQLAGGRHICPNSQHLWRRSAAAIGGDGVGR